MLGAAVLLLQDSLDTPTATVIFQGRRRLHTSLPLSNGFVFQQSCRPNASTALCSVRLISALHRSANNPYLLGGCH